MPNQRGQVASILIQPTNAQNENTLQEILAGIGQIFEGNFEKSCPVSEGSLVYKSFFQCLKDEWRYCEKHLSTEFGKRLLSTVLCVLAFRFKLPLFIDVDNYFKQIFNHSDYRKFDDTLRMILDCSTTEVQQIENFLQEQYNLGKIYFGIHISTHSLMTCLVENTQQGGHIHFIDGGNGGYAMAAKAMKIQIKSDRNSPFKQAN